MLACTLCGRVDDHLAKDCPWGLDDDGPGVGMETPIDGVYVVTRCGGARHAPPALGVDTPGMPALLGSYQEANCGDGADFRVVHPNSFAAISCVDASLAYALVERRVAANKNVGRGGRCLDLFRCQLALEIA